MKISVIGAGNVGATTAHLIALKKLGDVVLFDIVKGMPHGKALDIMESSPLEGFNCKVIGSGDYKDTSGSDIVVITAGMPRKPGMSRDDLVNINKEIVKEVTLNVVKHSPKCILLVVSNPLDAMVYVAYKVSKFDKSKVIGMAGVLDSSRMRYFISEMLEAPASKVEAMVLGGHGDTMVPLMRLAKFHGKPLSEMLSKKDMDKIVSRTRNAGTEIVSLLKTGSAYYSTASSIVEMIDAIANDTKKVLPCAAYLDGEYGVKGLFIGVPCKLGKAGVEGVVELDLNKEEKKAFEETVEHVKGVIEKVK